MEKDVDASWRKAKDALESMSLVTLANQLKEKYCISESNLDLPSSEKELMMDRQELIVRKIEELEDRYLLLVTNVHSAVAEANPSLIKLQMFSNFYANIRVARQCLPM